MSGRAERLIIDGAESSVISEDVHEPRSTSRIHRIKFTALNSTNPFLPYLFSESRE